MKNFLALFFGCMLFMGVSNNLSAQEFHHGAGISYSYQITDNFIGGSPELTYHPRIAFKINRGASYSIGAPVSLGFSFNASTTGESSSSLAYGIPVTFDLNLGYGCLNRSRNDFGGYFGVGYGVYGFSYVANRDFNTRGESGFLNNHGLYAHGGVRWHIGDKYRMSTGLFTYQSFQGVMVFGFRAIYEITDFR